jgi:hypothetical protein
MPLPGGSSDKIGNRFELWWTALCLADILDERAENITIEPPGDLGDGIEFILVRKGVAQHHQVKRQTTRGLGWSIASLRAVGVLQNIPSKITGDCSEFHFVSTMAAPELSELSENSRHESDLDRFRSSFLATNKRAECWTELCGEFRRDSERDCYEILRRLHVDTVSEELLRRQVLARVSAIVDGPDRQVANELVCCALDSVNARLTPDLLWKYLNGFGFRRRSWANDPHVLAALDSSNRHFLDSRTREFFRKLFPQPLAAEISQSLNTENARHTLVSAPAGGGKSGLIVQVIEKLEDMGIPYLAVRLDRLDPTLRTTTQIGEKLDLPGSPASLLGAVAQGRRGVLVLDQLDAISLISGKNPDLFDPVCDLLQEVTAFPELRVVAACRTFDLDNDYRLKKLSADPMFVRRFLSPLPREYVLMGVADAGFEPSSLSEKQIDLLSNPLSLSMLADLRPPSPRPIGIETSVDLFDTFWKRKLSDLQQVGVTPDQCDQVVDLLCQLLEKRGSLFIPEPLLTHHAAEKLASAHILSHSERQWGFFHESFYDFANARRLYRLGKALPSYLAEHGQAIELRNQLRQSLAFRRAYDPARYRDDLRDLLAAPGIRFHLKSAAVAFLRALTDPTPAEWDIVREFMETEPGSDLARALFTLIGLTPAWFRLACDSDAVNKWLGVPTPAIQNLLAWTLIQVERHDPDRVAPLLREACASGPDGKRLAAMVLDRSELTSNRAIFDLYKELLAEGMFVHAGAHRSVPWMHLYRIAVSKPEWACEVLGMLLRKAVTIASDLGVPNPFAPEVGVLADDQMDDEVIQRMHQGAPVVFFDETWPSICSIVASNRDGDGSPFADKIWRFYDPEFNHRLHEKIIRGIEAGIRALAAGDFGRFSHVVDAAKSLHASTIECLLVSGFASVAEDHPDEAVRFVLADTSRLNVGWRNTEPAAELIAKASETCSVATLSSLQTVLLNWYPQWERNAADHKAFGWSQYRLLSSVSENRRTDEIRRRLQEWERKFGVLSEKSSNSHVAMGHIVPPPIRSEAADAMTDDQWLGAIAKYSSSTFNLKSDGTPHSGWLGLAQELQRVARNDRVRFARFLEKIPVTSNPAYFEAIIIALADESVSSEMALTACRVGHHLEGKPLGHSIPYCLGKTCAAAPPAEAILMICEYISPQYSPEVRDSALVNLGNLLRSDRTRIQAALPYLELFARGVPRELRSHFCYALTPFFGTDFQLHVARLFSPMWSADQWLPPDHLVDQFLRMALWWDEPGFKEVIENLLTNNDPQMRLMAARWVAFAGLTAEEPLSLSAKLADGDEYVRQGLAEVCAANVKFAKFRDHCARELAVFFRDQVPAVRMAACECFRELEGENLGELWDLVGSFLDSPSAEISLRGLLDSLLRSTVRHDALTLRACELAIDHVVAGKDLAYSELPISRDLVLRTYHQSTVAALRERSLDMIDRLLGLEVEGLESALLEIEAGR